MLSYIQTLPYQNTSGYNVDFDFEKFKEFISNYKCYVSEYNLEHKDYEVIFEKIKRNIGGVATEKIYAHRYFIQKSNDKSRKTNGLFQCNFFHLSFKVDFQCIHYDDTIIFSCEI